MLILDILRHRGHYDLYTSPHLNNMVILYLAGQAFQEEDSRRPVLAAGASKARKMNADSEPRFEAGWITARRRSLSGYLGLYCGDGLSPSNPSVKQHCFKSQGVSAQAVHCGWSPLPVRSGSRPCLVKQTAFPMEIQSVELKLSLYSIVVRLLSTVWIVWSLFQTMHARTWMLTSSSKLSF